jgi:hypothetical protein
MRATSSASCMAPREAANCRAASPCRHGGFAGAGWVGGGRAVTLGGVGRVGHKWPRRRPSTPPLLPPSGQPAAAARSPAPQKRGAQQARARLEASQDLPLEEDGPPLIQPKVLLPARPGRGRDVPAEEGDRVASWCLGGLGAGREAAPPCAHARTTRETLPPRPHSPTCAPAVKPRPPEPAPLPRPRQHPPTQEALVTKFPCSGLVWGIGGGGEELLGALACVHWSPRESERGQSAAKA